MPHSPTIRKVLGSIWVLVLLAPLTISWYLSRPDRATQAYQRGTQLAEQGKLDEAIICFDEAIQFKPGYGEAYCNRGTAYGKKGEYDKAFGDLTKAIEINPNDFLAKTNLAFIITGRDFRAQTAVLKGLIQDTTNPLRENLAILALQDAHRHMKEGNIDKAISAYSESIKTNPTESVFAAYYWRGAAYRKQADSAKAIVDFGEAIRISRKMLEQDSRSSFASEYLAKSLEARAEVSRENGDSAGSEADYKELKKLYAGDDAEKQKSK